MEALYFVGPGSLEWREVTAPRLEAPQAAIVRPVAVASCDLDAAAIRGHAPLPGPFPIGHECVARVVEVGDAVTSVRPGDCVVVPFQISCGICGFCRRGRTGQCSAASRGRGGRGAAMYGIGPAGGDHGGALSDRLRVPFADAMLLALPEGVTPEAAASAGDNVADAWRTVAPGLAEIPGARVLVLNGGAAGSIALYATATALALGAERVDYFDRNAKRVELARALGAQAATVSDWPQELGRYPVTVEGTQEKEGLACALRSTEPAGYCTSTSIIYGPGTEIPLLEMYFRSVHLRTGLVDSRAALPHVLGLISSQRLDPRRITTDTAAWLDARKALADYDTKLIVIREDP